MNPDNRCQCGAEKLYAGQKPTEANGFTHAPDECLPHVGAMAFSCPTCRETYRILGIAPADQARALREWQGCCDQSPLGGDGGEADATGAPDTRADRAHAATFAPTRSALATTERGDGRRGFLRRVLSGVPAHVRRRVATWPFDPADFTT